VKNVIVFALGGARYAVELRWVREVVTLGFVTPVPTAPAAIGGLANLRGAVTPVIDVRPALGIAVPSRGDDDTPARGPRKGDSAVVLDVDGVVAALWMSNVEQVATLREAGPGEVADAKGRAIPLLDAPEVARRVRAQVIAAREAAPAAGGSNGEVGRDDA